MERHYSNQKAIRISQGHGQWSSTQTPLSSQCHTYMYIGLRHRIGDRIRGNFPPTHACKLTRREFEYLPNSEPKVFHTTGGGLLMAESVNNWVRLHKVSYSINSSEYIVRSSLQILTASFKVKQKTKNSNADLLNQIWQISISNVFMSSFSKRNIIYTIVWWQCMRLWTSLFS